MPNTDQSTNAVHHSPPETACPPGFNQPDTLDWSSLFAQVKNQLVLVPSAPPRWMNLSPKEDDSTDDKPTRATEWPPMTRTD